MVLDIAHLLQAWHFLGPVTRFQSRTKPVIYEIAQVTIVVENRSPESDGVNRGGIVVYSQDEACHLNACSCRS